MHTIMNKPEEEKDTAVLFGTTQTVSTTQMQNPISWGTILNNAAGAAGPVNPIPTSPKITFDAAADAYEITYPNGFSNHVSKSDVEDTPDSVRDLVNSLLAKP
jgi:hypothetical protein